MRKQPFILIALLASTGLTGCNRNEHPVMKVEKHLMVMGPQDGVKRFLKLQSSLRPDLPASIALFLKNGRAEAKVTLPASYGGEDLVHLTREALAAGLDYRFEERRSVWTRPS